MQEAFPWPAGCGHKCSHSVKLLADLLMVLSAQADMRQAAKVSAIIAAMPRTHSSISSAPGAGEGGLPGLEVLPHNPGCSTSVHFGKS